MKIHLLVILAFLAISYTGCKDSAYTPPPPSQANTYLPETAGSTWRYRDSIYSEPTDTATIAGVKIDTLTFTINGGTTDFNGRICYNVGISSIQNGPGTAYFFAENHTFGLFEQVTPFGLTDFEVLVDPASAGYSWVSAPTLNTLLNGSPIRSVNTIVEKNIVKKVGLQTFTDVIHTSVNFEINVNGAGFHNIAYYDFYLAKGIGLIEKDAYVYGNLNETETILNYNIK